MTFTIGTPFTRNAGYYYNWELRGKSEADVQTCVHCQAVILMQQWNQIDAKTGKLAGGFCMRCNAPICEQCAPKMATEGCIPFIRKIEQQVDMVTKLDKYLKDAGLEPVAPRPLFTGVILEE
jgi:hypothetical protein